MLDRPEKRVGTDIVNVTPAKTGLGHKDTPALTITDKMPFGWLRIHLASNLLDGFGYSAVVNITLHWAIPF